MDIGGKPQEFEAESRQGKSSRRHLAAKQPEACEKRSESMRTR